MKSIMMLALVVGTCSCTLLRKDEGDDELVKMGQMVIKSHEGIDIIIQPIPIQKK